jgi:hypothetical protein
MCDRILVENQLCSWNGRLLSAGFGFRGLRKVGENSLMEPEGRLDFAKRELATIQTVENSPQTKTKPSTQNQT